MFAAMVDSTVTSKELPPQVKGTHRLWIVWTPDPLQRGTGCYLTQTRTVVGRAPGGQDGLTLGDPEASREHGWVEVTRDGYVLTDRSRNGCFVNGIRVERAELRAGDVVRMGTTMLLFDYVDARGVDILSSSHRTPSKLVGDGHRMEALRQDIAKVAPQPEVALVLGETGAGKELVAAQLHDCSGRKGRYVPVNCAAIPKELLESELFGHVKGAFTQAQKREGLFGQAAEGTLFLDEIGELPLELQAKMLRALEDGSVRAVGSDVERKVNARVVAATNVDLQQAVAQGRFREDLLARLEVHLLHVPSLRERKEDIPGLVEHFLRGKNREARITIDAWEALLVANWPQNVRQLQKGLAHAATQASDGILDLPDLPDWMTEVFAPRRRVIDPEIAPPSVPPPPSPAPRATPSEGEVRRLLQAFGGVVHRAA